MSNLNLNKVVLCGRLTADPELKQTQTGIAVVSFSLAINRRATKGADGTYNSQADFINCTAWRQQAEFISRYFRKGSSLCITGSIQQNTWTDNNGQKRNDYRVVVDEAMFVDSRNEGAGRDASSAVPYSAEPYATPGAAESFDIIKDDDDLPF